MPRGRRSFAARVIEDVRARLVVGDVGLLAGLKERITEDTEEKRGHRESGGEIERMDLRGIGAELPAEPLFAVSDPVTEDAAFQIVFTSGTTSEPKGIVHTHRNVLVTLRPIEAEMKKYGQVERVFHPLRFLHSLPLSHVFGQFMGLWCPALLGAEVHFAEQLEPSRMVELIRRERISVLVAVPRVLHMVRVHLLGRFPEISSKLSVVRSQLKGKGHDGGRKVREVEADDRRGRSFDSARARSAQDDGPEEKLRTENSQLTTVVKKWWRYRRVHRALGWKFWAVISGGATLPAELEAFWNGLGYALIQGYGMTETAALVTLNHPFHIAPGTIGKTLPGREVKIGEDGEILVRGEMLAGATWQGGTMHRREGEWLATGDLAEREASGELKFLGRKGDVIVTSAGLNIHPADLESAMAAQVGVRGCVVIGCDFNAGPEAVAVVLFSGTEEELDAAVTAANRGLAEYQKIRHVVRWTELEFPYTSTGKVVRRRVAEWVCGRMGVDGGRVRQVEGSDGRGRSFDSGRDATSAQDDGAAARTPDALLKVVTGVTGEPTSLRDVGHPDSLRLSEDLHLDSLGRVELLSAVEQRFGVELEDDAVAAVETVGELRALVERELGGRQSQEATAQSREVGHPVSRDTEQQVEEPAVIDQQPAITDAGADERLSEPTSQKRDVGHPAQLADEHVYPRWPWWWWVRWVRVIWIEAVMRPLVWLLARPRVVIEAGSRFEVQGSRESSAPLSDHLQSRHRV